MKSYTRFFHSIAALGVSFMIFSILANIGNYVYKFSDNGSIRLYNKINGKILDFRMTGLLIALIGFYLNIITEKAIEMYDIIRYSHESKELIGGIIKKCLYLVISGIIYLVLLSIVNNIIDSLFK